MACQDLTELSLQDQKSFFNSFDTVLTDCDGVLWSGNTPIPGSVEMIHKFREMGKKVIYVTNNATRSRKEYVTKMEDLGFGGTYVSIYAYLLSEFEKSTCPPPKKKIVKSISRNFVSVSEGIKNFKSCFEKLYCKYSMALY